MRIHAPIQRQPQRKASSDISRSNAKPVVTNHAVHSVLYLQRTIGNQAVQRLLQAKSIPLGNPQLPHFFDGKPKKEEQKKPPPEKEKKLEWKKEKKPEPKKPPSREPCDNKCGIGSFGNTECELDLTGSGVLTGKVKKEVFDTNPCTRPCVEVHEGVHAKKIAPICTATKKCLDAARGDYNKQGKCLDKLEADMNALTFSTECAAYTAEEECLDKNAKKTACKSTDGKKRWQEQMAMVKCYKGCFCKG